MRKIVLSVLLLGFLLVGSAMSAPSSSVAATPKYNGPVVKGTPDHHYYVSGYIDELWLSFNPDGTINGYDVAPGVYYAPILGMGKESQMLLFLDFPTGVGEELGMCIFIGLNGNAYFTMDGLAIDYTLYLTLIPAAEANTGGKVLASSMQTKQPTTDALRAFHLNPWIDIQFFTRLSVSTEAYMIIGGYADVPEHPCYPAPTLGIKAGKRLIWADDYVTGEGCYELRMNSINVPTMDGNSWATIDGTDIGGPTYIWLTPA